MRNLHSEITSRILTALHAGTVPWRKPWSQAASGGMPCNAVSGRAYSGANVVLCWLTAQERGYTSPRWLTFKQAIEAGGAVRKGEKGTTVIFVSTFAKANDAGELRNVPFLKSFTVFNVAQCDGLPAHVTGAKPVAARNPDERDAIAEAFAGATGATIHHSGAQAYYRRATDSVTMPAFTAFDNSAAYYGTLFHELTHWTGAEHRLNRDMGKRFGDASYSAEELVAELGSAFLCAEFQFDREENNAAYIAHWIKFLTEHEKAFVAAASAASKAVEHMRDLAVASETPIEQDEAA
jgi:antirestriction protein ArdC